MVLAAALPALCARSAEATLEEKVKAAFVFNFMQFTEWPAGTFAGANSPIVVGFVGDTAVEEVLRSVVADKTVNGRAVAVKRVESDSEAATCQVLVFAGDDEARRLERMRGLSGRSVLTIGDSEEFPEAGGVIGFYLDGGKERFEVNTLAAERAHLQISSKLLKLAKIVRK